jgi:L-arabinonolactonase
MTLSIAASTQDLLGEGPLHDAADGSLRWVDIGRGNWHRLDLATGHVSSQAFDVPLSAFAPTDAGDYIGAFTIGLARFNALGQRSTWLAQPELELPDNRFNDGGTDPAGRFLAGTMNMVGGPPTGSLYSLSGGLLATLRQKIGIVNTVAFSPDGQTLYTADSAAGDLAAYAYDPATSNVGNRLPGFRPDPALPGVPDGSAIDAEGFLWNARWEGRCVVRLAPDGSTDRIIELPVRLATSCAFVGTTLYITTATWNFTDEDRKAEPWAGNLLKIDVGVVGLPRPAFATRAQ